MNSVTSLKQESSSGVELWHRKNNMAAKRLEKAVYSVLRCSAACPTQPFCVVFISENAARRSQAMLMETHKPTLIGFSLILQ